MSRAFKIGTRGSKLALAQAGTVVEALELSAPGASFELEVVRTQGDRSADAPQARSFGVGVFVREIERALVEHRVDVAVHSMKDLPTDVTAGTLIAAVPERADARDVLVTRDGLTFDQLPSGARIGTSSPRRRSELLRARGDLALVPVRGNLDTRLRKLDEGEGGMSAIVVAAAGLARLGLLVGLMDAGAEGSTAEFLPLERFPSPAGQGALAVQVCEDDDEARDIVGRIDHLASHAACDAERAFIRSLGAGCRTPVGAYATVAGDAVKLLGAVYSADGAECIEGEESGTIAEAERVGARLAEMLVAKGAGELLAAAREDTP